MAAVNDASGRGMSASHYEVQNIDVPGPIRKPMQETVLTTEAVGLVRLSRAGTIPTAQERGRPHGRDRVSVRDASYQ